MTAYDRLTDRFARIATSARPAPCWTGTRRPMMPSGGGAARGDQLAVLAGLGHAMLTGPRVGDDLAEAEASPPERRLGRAPTCD